MSSNELQGQRELAWLTKQGPDAALLYKFRLRQAFFPGPLVVCDEPGCRSLAQWTVARSPYSEDDERHYCTADCPNVPEGTS